MNARRSLLTVTALVLLAVLLMNTAFPVQAGEDKTVLTVNDTAAWAPGNYRSFSLVVSSSQPVQFRAHLYSPCQLKGNNSQESDPEVTIVTFTWNVTVWNDQRPGLCEVAAEVSMKGSTHPTPILMSNIITLQVLPAVGIGIITPVDPVIYGHRPVAFTVTAINNTPDEQRFDLVVWHGGPAWGREDYPLTTTNSRVYNIECSSAIDGCRHYWEGVLQAGEVATFTIPTFSGITLGTFRFVTVDANPPSLLPVHVERYITLTEGDEPKNGVLKLDGDMPWKPGELKGLRLTLTAPYLTQFRVINVRSTCGLEGLPGEAYSASERTWAQFLWYVRLPDDARSGNCTIKAMIGASGYIGYIEPTVTFSVQGKYFLPLVVR